MFDSQLDDIKKANESLRSQVADLMSGLKATAVDLDLRWKAFLELAKLDLLKVDNYGDGHLEEYFPLYPYDDFYIERYETTRYSDLYYNCLRDREELEPGSLDAWRERVLSEGYGAFIYDW